MNTSISQAFQQAIEFHQAGHLPQAETCYLQILQIDPHHLDALHLLGLLAHELGRNELAVELIGKALALQPDFVEAHSNIGLALKELGKLDEAAGHYRKALSLRPDYAEVHSNLGIVLQVQGKLDEAAASYRKALSLQPYFAEAHNHLGLVLQTQDKLFWSHDVTHQSETKKRKVIGLIQTRGIGDIIIAAPIAQYFIHQGHEVFWPVDDRIYSAVQAAFPEIRFIPIHMPINMEDDNGIFSYFYGQPFAELARVGCDTVHSLYSSFHGMGVVNHKLAQSLKFDEYKYAIAGVPFSQKWKLKIARDPNREQRLFQQLNIRGDYLLMHDEAAGFKPDIQLPEDMLRDYQVIKISELSENPFDWIGVIEGASVFVCVDSCFANLAEQLNLCERKYLFLRSETSFTPVFKNNWLFMWTIS